MRAHSLLVLVVLAASACQPLPGDVVGTFQVSMKLVENTCGAGAVHSLDGKRYAVELRKEDDEAYWRIPGQTPLGGKYEAPNFTFEYSSIVAKETNDAGTKSCSLVQTELLRGRIDTDPADASVPEEAQEDAAASDAEAPVEETPSALKAEHTMTISALSGSDCTIAMAPQGSFEKLPCVLRYELTGTPRKKL